MLRNLMRLFNLSVRDGTATDKSIGTLVAMFQFYHLNPQMIANRDADIATAKMFHCMQMFFGFELNYLERAATMTILNKIIDRKVIKGQAVRNFLCLHISPSDVCDIVVGFICPIDTLTTYQSFGNTPDSEPSFSKRGHASIACKLPSNTRP
jgi:hypothetical protein